MECACALLCRPTPANLMKAAPPAGTVDLAAVPLSWPKKLPVTAQTGLLNAMEAWSVGNSALVKSNRMRTAPALCTSNALQASAPEASAQPSLLPLVLSHLNVPRATLVTATPVQSTSHWALPVIMITPSVCHKLAWPTSVSMCRISPAQWG